MDLTESLSRQQRRCLEAVARGLSTPEIAFELKLAESTVNGHIEAAVRKLGAPNRRHAAYMLAKATPAKPPENIPGDILPVDPIPTDTPVEVPDRVAEERVAFVSPPPVWERREDVREAKPNPLTVVVLIFLIAAFLVLLLLAVDPLSESASRLANRIQAPIVR